MSDYRELVERLRQLRAEHLDAAIKEGREG